MSAGASGGLLIRPMTAGDWPAAAAIYAEGIATGHATFETEVPTWAGWDAGHLADQRFVGADPAGTVLGWAALAPVSVRAVYAGVAENSVYVASSARGRGVGRALLRHLLDSADRAGIWTVQTGIFPENTVSVALHESVGFRVVGRRERLGRQHGRWRDVIMLERRSAVAGRSD
jgi:phosphinothricin acetyltransferase